MGTTYILAMKIAIATTIAESPDTAQALLEVKTVTTSVTFLG